MCGANTQAVLEVAQPDGVPAPVYTGAAVVAAVVIFIATVENLGLIPASVLSMIAAYLGQTNWKFTGFLFYAVCFATAAWLLFTKGLGMPLPAFGG